jgi:hypothetical protein
MATGLLPAGIRSKRARAEGSNSETHPHSQALGPGREPEVLDGAGDRGKIHLWQRAPTEDMTFAPLGKRRHEELTAPQDPFSLETEKLVTA